MGGAESARRRQPGLVDVLRTVRADPARMPERLAALAVEYLGPQAAATTTEARASERAGAAREEITERVVSRGVRRSVVDGSFLGGPFVLLLPVAFVAALLAQLRMVLELGALAGVDPCGDDAVVEVLLVQGVHRTPEAAREALRSAAAAGPGGTSGGSWAAVVRRQAYLIGLVAPDTSTRGRVRKWLGWTGIGVLMVVGTVIPFVWVPACAEMYRRATTQLADRALLRFGLADAEAEEVRTRNRSVLRPGLLLVVLRTGLACLTTAGAVVVVLLTGVRVADNALLAMFLLLLGLSTVVAGWYSFRSHRTSPSRAARGRPGNGARQD
ncbi:hypothetical protein [Streptomyces sp. NRRL S-350]|uniref:hypothetical protein n=1 Tax=Streptomyces sp. NRRL S-350 TaxID=1463902 RepID=UPI00131D58AE|nr:hypothetical protein [Streptomyces sp. NRRL S-350]